MVGPVEGSAFDQLMKQPGDGRGGPDLLIDDASAHYARAKAAGRLSDIEDPKSAADAAIPAAIPRVISEFRHLRSLAAPSPDPEVGRGSAARGVASRRWLSWRAAMIAVAATIGWMYGPACWPQESASPMCPPRSRQASSRAVGERAARREAAERAARTLEQLGRERTLARRTRGMTVRAAQSEKSAKDTAGGLPEAREASYRSVPPRQQGACGACRQGCSRQMKHVEREAETARGCWRRRARPGPPNRQRGRLAIKPSRNGRAERPRSALPKKRLLPGEPHRSSATGPPASLRAPRRGNTAGRAGPVIARQQYLGSAKMPPLAGPGSDKSAP
jgi:hypothetical protein